MVSEMCKIGLPSAGKVEGNATGVFSNIFSSASAVGAMDVAAKTTAVAATADLNNFIVNLMGSLFLYKF
jgi:hypothetical protein